MAVTRRRRRGASIDLNLRGQVEKFGGAREGLVVAGADETLVGALLIKLTLLMGGKRG